MHCLCSVEVAPEKTVVERVRASDVSTAGNSAFSDFLQEDLFEVVVWLQQPIDLSLCIIGNLCNTDGQLCNCGMLFFFSPDSSSDSSPSDVETSGPCRLAGEKQGR